MVHSTIWFFLVRISYLQYIKILNFSQNYLSKEQKSWLGFCRRCQIEKWGKKIIGFSYVEFIKIMIDIDFIAIISFNFYGCT